MKALKLLAAILGLYAYAYFCVWMAVKVHGDGRVETLAAENENLRMFNSRRQRRLIKPPATPRDQSIAKAEHIFGTPYPVIKAVWRQENGPPDIETGSIGKTDYIAMTFPVSDWAAAECARTLNRMAWEWFLTTPEGRDALGHMLLKSAGPYTAMDKERQKDWARNVKGFILEEQAINPQR